MLGLFGDLAPKLKPVANKVRFDSVVNRLHYRVTSGFLLVCCVLCCATEFIGAPIQCIVEGGPGQFGKAVNTYCWIQSTYTLPEHYDKTLGVEVPHPGVGPYNPMNVEKKYHAYYQWVPFVLLFQAILFYAPHFLFRVWESKDLSRLLGDLASRDVVEHGEKHDQYRPVVKYLTRTRGHHGSIFWKFMVCEILNFVMVVGNIAFTDLFLGGEFKQFGAQVLEFMGQEDEKRTDPLTKVFPRVTKCDWHQYGPSGTIQKYDALCVLAINIINEKIYVFLWFWFVLLAAITGIWLIVRAIMVVIPGARRYRLLRLVGARGDHSWAVRSIVDNLGISDWFVVLNIGDHMDPLYYPGFVANLAEEISNPEPADGKAGQRAYSTMPLGADHGKASD